MKKLSIIIILLTLFFNKNYSQYILESDEVNDNFRAQWIVLISENTLWPREDTMSKIKILVFSNYKGVYNKLNENLSGKKIKNKDVELSISTKTRILEQYQIIYVGFDKLVDVYKINKIIDQKPILMITDRLDDIENLMVNIRPFDIDEKRIDVDVKKITNQGLKVTDQLIYHGGNEDEIKGIYSKQKKELDAQIAELERKKQEIEQLQKEMDEKSKELNEQKKLIEIQNKNLAQLTEQFEQQKEQVFENEKKLREQEELIKYKQFELQKQVQEFKKQESILITKNEEIHKKEKELADLETLIDDARKNLNRATQTIESQNVIIKIIIVFSIIVIIFSFFLFRALRRNRKLNKELVNKNTEITNQKEHIEQQAQLLENQNKELEKLSLVAEHAQNGVVIMDKEGNIEWLNAGFTKMYGYTLQLFLNEVDKNIIGASSNAEIKEIVRRCILDKKPVSYEAKTSTRNSHSIYVKTTLTPILDAENNIRKIIAIDTDITALKIAYEQIEKQHGIISEQNEKISSSIKYALTIQKAILPLKETIDKYVESEIIFLPKDIVSGDFYWFYPVDNDNFYAAVVDCTGHGVPGAFMSLIVSRMLNEIVLNNHKIEPFEILEKLEKNIVKALNQENSQNKDGVDLSIIKVNKSNKIEIKFAGAKRNLFFYKKIENKIMQLDANKTSLGGIKRRNEVNFEQETVELLKDDIVFLSTDGYVDQNNYNRKKFGTNKFVSILEENKDKPLIDQKQVLVNEFEKHIYKTEQRDDITIWIMKFI